MSDMTDTQILDWLIAHRFVELENEWEHPEVGRLVDLRSGKQVASVPAEITDVREAVKFLVEMNR